MEKPKRILVAPLNWGLGHATRCIPIIDELLKQGFEVILASDGRSLQILKKEFPKLKFVDLPAYDIHYTTNSMIFNIAYQIPKILFAICKEFHFINKLAKKEKIDIIISDNRYGCIGFQTKNIFITHQINIIIPFKPLEWLVNKCNHFLINRFDECWVPDFQGETSLSGQLSKGESIKKVKYLGLLSRMKNLSETSKYDIIAVISGPEPQRTKFEKLVVDELKSIDKKSLVVLGKPNEENRFRTNEYLELVSHLNTNELNKAIESSELVICRSGYSSVMDLVRLKKHAILIPTPGQTEQEYLADRLRDKRYFYVQNQSSFSIEKGLQEIAKYNHPIEMENNHSELAKIIFALNY